MRDRSPSTDGRRHEHQHQHQTRSGSATTAPIAAAVKDATGCRSDPPPVPSVRKARSDESAQSYHASFLELGPPGGGVSGSVSRVNNGSTRDPRTRRDDAEMTVNANANEPKEREGPHRHRAAAGITASAPVDEPAPAPGSTSRRRQKHRKHKHSPGAIATNSFYLPPLFSEVELESAGVVSIRTVQKRGSLEVGVGSAVGSPRSGGARSPLSAGGAGGARSPVGGGEGGGASLGRTTTNSSKRPSTLRKMSSFFACWPTDQLQSFEEPRPPRSGDNWVSAFQASRGAKVAKQHQSPSSSRGGWPPLAPPPVPPLHRQYQQKKPSATDNQQRRGSAANAQRETSIPMTTTRQHRRASDIPRNNDVLSQAVAHSLGIFPIVVEVADKPRKPRRLSPLTPTPAEESQKQQEESSNGRNSSNPKVPFPQQWFEASQQSESSEEFPAWCGSLSPQRLVVRLSHTIDSQAGDGDGNRDGDGDADGEGDQTHEGVITWLGLVDAPDADESSYHPHRESSCHQHHESSYRQHRHVLTDAAEFVAQAEAMFAEDDTEEDFTLDRIMDWRAGVSPGLETDEY